MCREGALQGPCNAKGPRGTSGQAGQPCVLEPQTAWVAETSHEDAEAEEAGMGLRRWDLTISVQVMQGAARGEGRPAGGVEEERQHRTMASGVPVRGTPWLLPLDGFADERWGPWMETTWPRPFQHREPGCICFAGCRTNAPQANSWSHSSGGQKSKVRGGQSWFLARALREHLLGLSPSFWWFAGNHIPWLTEASPPFLPSSLHGAPGVCFSLSKFPLFVKKPLIFDQGPS